MKTFKVAEDYEEMYGSETLLKACVSAMNMVLVGKGLVTEAELQNAFLDVIWGGKKRFKTVKGKKMRTNRARNQQQNNRSGPG